MDNIREQVWKIIDTDVAMKKDLSRGLLNIRALGNYIIKEHKIKASLDAVISAIRRYYIQPINKVEHSKIYSILKQAKIGTVTKISSLSLKKDEPVHHKISEVLPNTDFTSGDILRVLEGSKIFKLIFDQKDFDTMSNFFGKDHIVGSSKKLGMIEIIYPSQLEVTPGVFSVLANELAENDVSIIDALICGNEHIIVISESNTLKAFECVFNLCK